MRELNLQELQAECLKILKDVHKFCIENDIMYSVAYGTLIGVIRHKGFIPWDDDIDIFMPRPDYDRFCDTFKSPYFKIKSPGKDKDCMIAFTRVYDDMRTITDSVVPWCGEKTGVWVDVFPIDAVPDRETFKEEPVYEQVVKDWSRSVTARTALGPFRKSKSFVFNVKLLGKKILFGKNGASKFIGRILDCQRAIAWGSTKHWSQLACLDDIEWHKMKDFVSVSPMPFEDTEVMVMNGYDSILRESFGDYMQLPPVEKRVGHSDGLTRFYWKK